MKTLRMYSSSLNERYLDEAADVLSDGEIIIYPTDTLYAIGCDATNNAAIERLCRVKELDPRRQTLSIVCSSLSMASEYARIDNEAFRILRTNLPGPFTFILPAATTLPKVFKGRRTVGIRIPDNPIACALAEHIGHPLLSTSIPQEYPETDPTALALEYEDTATLMIDGGDSDNMPSTVIDLTDSRNPILIREGKGILQ
ncbi:MAG: threonylcarbamoyl-AMP synthase [Duncaniella sp.]|nr:threonylcarbamoyl-AMP synthase [Duncaniella sp.]